MSEADPVPDLSQPLSLSVYRGKARSGKGEGPGSSVLQGEQYLLVDPRLYHDEILAPIRPWMTLDSDPADHQRLNDKLEAWSLFSSGGYLFVVRLVSAGNYDRRAAYFAHGRAWNADGLPPGFDPGLHLGCSEAFDAPWRDGRPAVEIPENTPTLVRPAQIGAEPATATLFLGHLLQAIVDGQPLIVTAPISDFTSGSPLPALISFARGALPADLRRKCRIRVYSRYPELFLRRLETNLVAIPEDAAGAALTARPGATLLDRQGNKHSGKDLSQQVHDYAAAVVERAIAIPEGLPYFSERFRHEPSDEETPGIQITYNLAFALAGPPDRRGEFLRKYLPRAAEKLGGDVDWNRLISNRDWSAFPAEALVDQLLTDSRDLSRARRGLLRAIEEGAALRGLTVDDRLPDWWNADDPGKRQRLVELLTHDPPLVSPEAAAQRTAAIPIDSLSSTGFLHTILDAEAKKGLLGGRNHQSEELSRAASDPRIFRILSTAVSEGHLDPEWARVLVRTATREPLIQAAEQWLGTSPFLREAWGDVPELLLDRLRSLDPPPTTLAALVKRAARSLEPLDHLRVYVRLADLLTRIDRPEGEALMRGLRGALPDLTAAQRQDLEGFVSGKEIVFEFEQLDLHALLDLGTSFRDQGIYERIYEELDHRMLRDPETTTEELVRRGWWYFWRCRSRLTGGNAADAEVLRRSALGWLCSEVWTQPEREATLEAWNQVIADLPGVLTGEELVRLRGANGRHRWPWIPPFEEKQLEELIRRIDDPGALAELTDAVGPDEWPLAVSFPDYVLSKSPFSDELTASGFTALLGGNEILSLEQSAYLCKHVRHRSDRAFKARIESVSNHLDQKAGEALDAAGQPNLWSDGVFLARVADWMNRKGSLQAVEISNAKSIDDRVGGSIRVKPALFPRSPSQVLLRELTVQGFRDAAGLLASEIPRGVQQEILVDETIRALLESRGADPCWQQLAKEVQSAETLQTDRHPLTAVAARIRDTLSRDQKRGLAERGWETLRAAAAQNPALMTERITPSVAGEMMPPLLTLVATMLGEGTLGIAAVRIASEVTNAAWRENPSLWRGLLRAIHDFKRHGQVSSADDRVETAVALLTGSLRSPAEEQAFDKALTHEANPGRDGSMNSETGQ